MPIYTFRNVDTGETEDKLMSMSQREPFLDSNPQLTQIHTKAPGLVSGTGDRTKTTAGFKEVDEEETLELINQYGYFVTDDKKGPLLRYLIKSKDFEAAEIARFNLIKQYEEDLRGLEKEENYEKACKLRDKIIIGLQNKNNQEQMYFGAKASRGRKYSFGYTSFDLEWGSFFNNNTAFQTAFKTEINYISPLIELKNWKIRQFIKPSYTWGNNRNPSEKDKLSLNEEYGIQGFNSSILGTQKWLVSFQTQTYPQAHRVNFRHQPGRLCAIGMGQRAGMVLYRPGRTA